MDLRHAAVSVQPIYEESVRETYVKYAEALEPKGVPPDLESELDKRDATIEILTRQVNNVSKDRIIS